MNLSAFCNNFYGQSRKKSALKGYVSQPSIVNYLMSTALGDAAERELAFTDDLFRKWFKGERKPHDNLWIIVQNEFDQARFSKEVASRINEKVLPDVMRKFDIIISTNDIPDKYAFSTALAKQFKALADGVGDSENIVSKVYQECLSVSEFPDYILKAKNKYSKLKTLLYTSEERPFDEFFVCNTINSSTRYNRPLKGKNIENVTMAKLAEKSRYVLLVGMGGIGKSMMMRHLFLSSIDAYSDRKLLPILVTLREYNAGNNDIFNLIVDSVHRFDSSFSSSHIHKLLSSGKGQILLDGLDEIKANDVDFFLRKLDALIDRYPNNQYVMSSRKISAFVELPRFTVMGMMPFTHSQALELIDKLEFCPEEPKLKQQFRDRLQKEYFKTHAEFVTNPLLLTLMLMNFRRFSDVPEKKYLFYEQAYQTLLQRHDSDKLAYKRVFHSVNDPSDFTWVFRELCAKSYRKGDYEFSRNKFESYFNKLTSLDRMDSDLMKPDNFLYDACHSACLMYEEGQSYHFLHRSFQEYFFADYYSRQDDNTLKRLGEYLEQSVPLLFDEGNAFDMLYDLAPDKVERFIIIPFLDKIFNIDGDNEKYWSFLKTAFHSWSYFKIDEKIIDRYRSDYKINRYYISMIDIIESTSIIMSFIFRLLKIDKPFEMKAIDDNFEDLIDGALYAETFRFETDPVPKLRLIGLPTHMTDEMNNSAEQPPIYNSLEKDKNGHLVKFGYLYDFDFDKALTQPEKYLSIIELWNKDTCMARKKYNTVREYYNKLKEKYDKIDTLDDDF